MYLKQKILNFTFTYLNIIHEASQDTLICTSDVVHLQHGRTYLFDRCDHSEVFDNNIDSCKFL